MPAIQLDRLKAQVNQLGEEISQPARYISRLHDLLDFYADRTRRPGQVGSRVPLLPHYNTPAPVMRELEHYLSVHIADLDTQQALDLIDALWADRSYETRLLASHLLSRCSASSDAVTARLGDWIQASGDRQVVETLLESGYAALSPSRNGLWMDLAQGWLNAERTGVQSIGLQALGLVIRDPGFENLPAIFKMLAPVLHSAPVALHTELTSLLHLLADRSPAETALFLRQALSISPNHSITRLVRRCLPFFDPSLQQPLREALASRLTME